MPDISIEALSVAVDTSPLYRPAAAYGESWAGLPAAVRSGSVPPEHLLVREPDETGEPGVAALALAALGTPARRQPLFLIRSGPLRDPSSALLARLEHDSGWDGGELGISLLEEQGGTLVFDLLDWALDDGAGGSVLVCDEPLCADARDGAPRFCAVGLRVRRGPGPLRVLACGEGEPPRARADQEQRPAAVRLAGRGPCDCWLSLHRTLARGEIHDGDRVMLSASGTGPGRAGWLLVQADKVADLTLAG
jgi:hypothetical protein